MPVLPDFVAEDLQRYVLEFSDPRDVSIRRVNQRSKGLVDSSERHSSIVGLFREWHMSPTQPWRSWDDYDGLQKQLTANKAQFLQTNYDNFPDFVEGERTIRTFDNFSYCEILWFGRVSFRKLDNDDRVGFGGWPPRVARGVARGVGAGFEMDLVFEDEIHDVAEPDFYD